MSSLIFAFLILAYARVAKCYLPKLANDSDHDVISGADSAENR